MKKNLLIMMMMVLCAGFASAQTINTVHGFVPGGSTGDGDNATYVVFGVPFSTIDADDPKEMSVTLAQMQLVYDTVEDVITCGQPYNANGISLSADSIQSLVICNKEDNNQEGQRAYLKLQIPNGAQYNYDSLLVVNLYICPCTKTDDESNDYEIIALDSKCWFKSNMRREDGGNGLLYNSDMTEVQDDSIYGRLYTWETVLKGDVCDNDGYLRGICPDGWHLPTVEEMGYLFGTPAENLRIDGNWVVEGNNNVTEFSAQPAGFYNASTQRFEGMFSETDFWMVNCNKLNEPQQEILQLVYSCNTPLRIVRPDEDALSVRCVYDIIKKLEDCDTNNTTPTPEPPTCPSVSNVQTNADLGFNAVISGATDNTTIKVAYVAGFNSAVPGQAGSYIDNNNQVAEDVDILNNSISWHYQNNNNYDLSYLTDLTAFVIIYNGGEAACDTETVNIPVPQIEPTYVCPTIGTITALSPDTGCTFTIQDYDGNQYVEVIYWFVSSDSYERHYATDNNPTISNQGSVTSHYPSNAEDFGDNTLYAMASVRVVDVPIYCGNDGVVSKVAPVANSTSTTCPTVGQPIFDNGNIIINVEDYNQELISLQEIEITINFTQGDPIVLENVNVDLSVTSNVASYTAALSSINSYDNVESIEVSARFIYNDANCSPNGDDAYDIYGFIPFAH